MKLYYHPASPNGRRAILTLRHLELTAEEIVIDFQRDLGTDEYKKLNPNQKIPTLVDGDFSLWESNAIMQYLATKRPEAGLLPKDEQARADITRWQFWNVAHFAQAVGTYNWENLLKSFFGGGEPDAAKLAQAEKDLARFGGVLDEHLKGKHFVCGDKLTLADLSIACTLMYHQPARVPLEKLGQVRRWLETMEQLPAWRATQPKMG